MSINIVNKYKHQPHEYIYCGRGSPLGNPYALQTEADRDVVCDKYESYFKRMLHSTSPAFHKALEEILDKARKGDINLGCFCAPKRCHCETIKQYIERKL